MGMGWPRRFRGMGLIIPLALAIALAPAITATAQPAPARAGLVVRFGDGRAVTRCVALPEGGLTGLELLERSGLDLAIQVQGQGALVCRIDQEGCPRDDCLCQCRSLGEGCRYWAYHSLQGGVWRYEQTGPTARRLGAGDVDGWAWGAGSVSAGAEPPPLTFAQICAASSPTAVASPSATAAPSAMPPATAPRPPTPTATLPRSRGGSSATSAPPTARATATVVAVVTTLTALPTGPTILASAPAALAADPTWAAGVRDRMRRATLAAYPTQLAALQTTAAARAGGQSPLTGAPTGVADAALPPVATAPPPVATALPSAGTVPAPVAESPPVPAPAGPSAPRIPWPALAVLAALGLAWWRGRRAGA